MLLQNTEMRHISRLRYQSCCFVLLCLWTFWQATKSPKAEHRDPQVWAVIVLLHPDCPPRSPDLKTASCWEMGEYGWGLAVGITLFLLLTLSTSRTPAQFCSAHGIQLPHKKRIWCEIVYTAL